MHEQVDGNYRDFGTFLLNDRTGALVDSIEKSQQTPEDIVTGILKKWLQGTEISVTWHSLITSLESSGHGSLAYTIKEKLEGRVSMNEETKDDQIRQGKNLTQ